MSLSSARLAFACLHVCVRACAQVGEVNVRVLALLDSAHTGHLGDPFPNPVSTRPVPGKCILVSVGTARCDASCNGV